LAATGLAPFRDMDKIATSETETIYNRYFFIVAIPYLAFWEKPTELIGATVEKSLLAAAAKALESRVRGGIILWIGKRNQHELLVNTAWEPLDFGAKLLQEARPGYIYFPGCAGCST